MEGKKVLIVEDDKFLRETLAKKFITSGLQVQTGVDGKNGLEMLKSFVPELVVLDLLLPDIDGFGFLQEMKKDANFTAVPVIVLSNLDKPDDMTKAKGLGAKDFMVKSNFTLNEIVNRVKSTLGVA